MKTKEIIFVIVIACFMQTGISQNVIITNSGNPNEPSIKMDPNNTDILVAGSNLNYYYTSNDGGNNWTKNILTSSQGVWGDPVIDVDSESNFYFFHLSNPPTGNWIDRIVCQKSTDNGNTWSDGSYAGLNGTLSQDKEWSVIDRTNNNIYMTWTQFDNYGSPNASDISLILFSKSIDGGETWSDALRINKVVGDCLDDDNTVEGATPAVGPNGEIYVTWAGPNGIVFNRSLDEGETWLEEEIAVDPMPGGWAYDIPGIMRANGLPVLKCDLSEGPNHGTLYVNWSDQRNGINDTDIWLSKSTDGGDTWTSPVRVNNDNSNKQQFFTWMDIDQTNGSLYFVFYDRRNYSDSKTDVYMAISDDGGETFFNTRISESTFYPNVDIFFGDYTNIVAHNDIIRPIWTRLHNGQLSLLTSVTPLSQILLSAPEITDNISNEISQYPNPATNFTYVSFKLHESSEITLEMFNQDGRLIKTIINKDEMDYGIHVIPINLNEMNLAPGIYFNKLSINGKSRTLKSIVIN